MSPRIYLLDTNIASYIISGRSAVARRKVESVPAHDVAAISSLTLGELHFGMQKYNPAATRRRDAFDYFQDRVTVLPWDSTTAFAYGTFRVLLASHGKSLATIDMLIAAHAYALGAVLVTHDRAFLQTAPLLEVEDWATDV